MDKTGCRIAILGLDHWYSALAYIPALARDPRIKIAGIAHHEFARAQKVASDFGVERVVAEPAALLEDKSIDAVAIFMSTDRVPDLCIAAAQAGKHILTIKPLARTLDEATAVVGAIRAMGVRLLPTEGVGAGGRRGPVELVRSMVSEGRLGEIAFARCSVSAGLPWSWPDNPKPGWFVDPARCAGGGWIDHAIYQIDRLRWILGREVESVRGTRHSSPQGPASGGLGLGLGGIRGWDACGASQRLVHAKRVHVPGSVRGRRCQGRGSGRYRHAPRTGCRDATAMGRP